MPDQPANAGVGASVDDAGASAPSVRAEETAQIGAASAEIEATSDRAEVGSGTDLDSASEGEAVAEDVVASSPAEAAAARVADPQLKAIIEALVFASPEPLTPKMLFRLLESEPKEDVELAVESLRHDYEGRGGLQLIEIAGGYQIVTRPEMHEWVRRLFHERKTQKLSVQALETLAVIAYKQPVTAPEVNEIRGVDTSAVFGTLLSRKLITTAGRKAVLGRPILYKTTREFLLRFGLRDVSELPSMEEFEKLAALEFDEQEQAAGEDSKQSANPELGLEFDEAASEELEDSPDEGLESEPGLQPKSPTTTAETAASN
jgi:segregation and condensation protein B